MLRQQVNNFLDYMRGKPLPETLNEDLGVTTRARKLSPGVIGPFSSRDSARH